MDSSLLALCDCLSPAVVSIRTPTSKSLIPREISSSVGSRQGQSLLFSASFSLISGSFDMRRRLPDDMGRGDPLWLDLTRRRVLSWTGGGGRWGRSGRRGGRRWGSWRTGGNGDQQTAAVSCFCHNCSAWNEVAPLKEDGKLETGR